MLGRIDQQPDETDSGNQFAQQPKLLGAQLAQEGAHAGRVAARPGDAKA